MACCSLLCLADRITTCRACPSMPPERRRVPGHGPAEAVLAFVGEAPGRFGADRTGVPFSGDRSGRFLRELIVELGLDAERDVYITNVVKELRLLRPRVVVPLGTLACRVLLDRPLREVRSAPVLRDGLWFFPLYHPSYAVSYGYPREQYRREFLGLRALLAALHRSPHEPEGSRHEENPADARDRGPSRQKQAAPASARARSHNRGSARTRRRRRSSGSPASLCSPGRTAFPRSLGHSRHWPRWAPGDSCHAAAGRPGRDISAAPCRSDQACDPQKPQVRGRVAI
jgi:DNA polymerase